MKVAYLLTNIKTLLTVVLATSTVGAPVDGWVEGISVGLYSDLKCFSLCDLPNMGSNGSTRSELNGSSLSLTTMMDYFAQYTIGGQHQVPSLMLLKIDTTC